MANTYTQIHIHAVFAVQFRRALIRPKWEETLFKYLGGILLNHGHKPIKINGMPDHVHVLFGLRPNQSLSEIMQHLKGCSSKWINETYYHPGFFRWQEGFGAFAVSKSRFRNVARYIENQKVHHARKSMRQEYLSLLAEYNVEFDEKYVFSDAA